MNKTIINLALGGVLAVSWGCRSYRPDAIDWQVEARDWQMSGEAVNLTLAEARELALILNPAINELRVNALQADNLALSSGWWEDPEFDFDLLRIIRGGSHPWILGAGLKCAIPVNGVPAIEKRAAQCYAEAERLAIDVAERELLAEVERYWLACQQDLRCAAIQGEYRKRLKAREEQVHNLIAAGELPRIEGERIRQELILLDLQCVCCGPEAVARRHALLNLIGIHPAAPLGIALEEPPTPALAGEPQDEADLLRHPKVMELLARYQGSEEELRAEIRRQYPDLHLGPLLEHEEGMARAGGSIGFNLPLWNRNRRGIAAAEGERARMRLKVIHVWRELVARWHANEATLRMARERLERTGKVLLPEVEAAARRTKELFERGESDVLAVLAADEAIYRAQEALLEAQSRVREGEIERALLLVKEREQGCGEQRLDALLAPAR